MKKSIFLLGLLAISGICLTACGSKNYEMSFDEALEIVNHSTFQEILSSNENVQQNFDIATNISANGTSIVADIESSSKENTKTNKSESSIKFNANISSEELDNIKVDGDLSIKLADEVLYLNIASLNLTGSQDLGFLAAMVEGFKNQWFSLPMSGLNELSNGYFNNLNELNAQTKEIVNNEGSVVYSGKFSQFNGYNARKISLNNEKLQEIINKYYQSLNTLDEEAEIPQLNIENFEGYLVITGKDKVTVVVDNMDLVDEESTINANGFGGENYALNLGSEGEDVISLTANKKGSKYDVAIIASETPILNGTITPKISKSSIDIKFDLKLTIANEGEADTIIPIKGSRSYEPISAFEVIIPEDAQDLGDLMESYLGGMLGGYDDYDYEDYDYEDYDYDYENYDDDDMVEEVAELEEVPAE